MPKAKVTRGIPAIKNNVLRIMLIITNSSGNRYTLPPRQHDLISMANAIVGHCGQVIRSTQTNTTAKRRNEVSKTTTVCYIVQ